MAAERSEAAPSAAAHPHHRRVYLVDRTFQLKYSLMLAAAGLVVPLVFGLWMWQAHLQTTEILVVDPELRPLAQAIDRQLLLVLAGIAVLMSAALGLLGLLVTHRVAGPIFVMGHYMQVLSQGRFPRMRTLRRHDELKSFFHLFLQAVATLKEREARHAALLEEAAGRMREAMDRAPELSAAMESLEAAARERRLALAQDDPELTPHYVEVFGGTGAERKPR